MSRRQLDIEMYLFRKPDGSESLHSSDYTQGNTVGFWVSSLGVCLGKVRVLAEYESLPTAPEDALLAMLEAKLAEEEQGAAQRAEALRAQIERLREAGRASPQP